MAREMDDKLKQSSAQQANSCLSTDGGSSFLDQVIAPLYEVVAAVGLRFFALSLINCKCICS